MVQFGLFINKQYPMGESPVQRVREHIEQVLGDVPKDQRCQGHDGADSQGFLKTIFGRK